MLTPFTSLNKPIGELLGSFFCCNCVLCGTSLRQNFALCEFCRNELPKIESYCTKCCSEVESQSLQNTICVKCLRNPPAFRHCRALFRYQPPINSLLRAYKFGEGFAEGRILSLLLARDFQQHYATSKIPDILIPVPLHRNRLRQRGFNQAVEIARTISGLCNIPVSLNQVIKNRDTAPQSELSKAARYRNLRNAFALNSRSGFKSVESAAIIDDIVTTTTTVSSLAGLLRAAGIQSIDVGYLPARLL